MVFFNYATMQMAAKIVYYGPGLCGKTTNLHHIYTKTSPQSRGEMVSLETETDRTLFFDLLPIDVGVIGGFKTRLQLYTVPGQVFYNTTRKLVLKGVDGMVFVADSQKAMLEANVESFKNLRENLAEIGTNLDELPLVIQLNKRDLPNIADPEVIVNALDPERRSEYVEAIAYTGVGVFETLKLISKLTLRTLRRRMTGEEPARPATSPRTSAQFRVQDNSRTLAGSTPIPAPAPAPTPAPAPAFRAASIAAETVEEIEAPPASVPEFDPNETVMARNFDRRLIADAPVADVVPQPTPAAEEISMPEPAAAPEEPEIAAAPPETEVAALPAEPEIAEPEIVIPVVEDAPRPLTLDEVGEPTTQYIPPPAVAAPVEAAPAPEVKTVKVRSSVDVMAELEALRKRATNTTTRVPKRDIMADLASLRPKRDLARTLHLQLPTDVLPRTKSVRVTLSFEDGEHGVIETRDQQVELGDTADVQSLSVNLKIDLA
jgi:hypothetical protein